MALRCQGVSGKSFLDACGVGDSQEEAGMGPPLWREDLVIVRLQGVGGEEVQRRGRWGSGLGDWPESEVTSQVEEEQV